MAEVESEHVNNSCIIVAEEACHSGAGPAAEAAEAAAVAATTAQLHCSGVQARPELKF